MAGSRLLVAAGLWALASHGAQSAPGAETPNPASSQRGQTAADGRKPDVGAPNPSSVKPSSGEPQRFDIDEFEVQGAEALPQIELEEAVYGFLGPNRTPADVEKARAALEKAYQAKGLQTVSVSVPPQSVERRVVVLKVTEAKVGRLRIKGSRYFDQEKIRDRAQSLKEGELPNFNDVTKDVVALNQWPDRRVTPALRAGVKPGTVDVDLNVEDTLPFHGTAELNNRRTANTKALRASTTARYENLWQLGHSLTLTGQLAPQRPEESYSFSASYLARIADMERLSLLFSALKAEGTTSIPGAAASGAAVANSPTLQLGARAVLTLPPRESFFHTFNVGLDYKESDQSTRIAGQTLGSPLHYVTAAATYSATYQGEKSLTALTADLVLGLRGLGSDPVEFDRKRFNAREDFVALKADLSHTFELDKGFELFGKAAGQLSDQPLVSSEQFGLGGLDSVRGYLESENVGDNGLFGSIEFRTPNLVSLWTPAPDKEPTPDSAPEPRFQPFDEVRLFSFVDAGFATLNDPLPEERDSFDAWSFGAGVNFKSFKYLNGSVVLALPMTTQAVSSDYTQSRDPRVLFRFWGEF